MNIKISYSDTISAFKGSAKKFLRFIFPKFFEDSTLLCIQKRVVSFLYIERKERRKNNETDIFLSDSVSGKNGSRFFQ